MNYFDISDKDRAELQKRLYDAIRDVVNDFGLEPGVGALGFHGDKRVTLTIPLSEKEKVPQ